MSALEKEGTGTQGAVYIAVGASYLAEAIVSASSLKRWHPTLPVTLFTDAPSETVCFDEVRPVNAQVHPKLTRQHVLCNLPYERTLVLDTDTYICGDILGIFRPLDQFEFSAMPAPYRYRHEDEAALGEFMSRIPRNYPQLNSGVMLFRRTGRVQALITRWTENYERDLEQVRASRYQHGWYRGIGEQGALREALYDTPLAWWALPSEYNCILTLPGYVQGEVKILHGRYVYFQEAAQRINSILAPRVYHVNNNYLLLVDDKGHSAQFDLQPYPRSPVGQLRRLTHAWSAYGWRDTMRRVYRNLTRRVTDKSQAYVEGRKNA